MLLTEKRAVGRKGPQFIGMTSSPSLDMYLNVYDQWSRQKQKLRRDLRVEGIALGITGE